MFLIVLSAIAMIWIIQRDIKILLQEKKRRYSDTNKINDYIKCWLSRAGRTVVLTRDMSWLSADGIKEILFKKAISNDLTILIESDTDLTVELKKNGAKIINYGRYNFVPTTRLTIIDFEKHGSRIAVATKEGDSHIITEIYSNDEPTFSLAHDLARVIINVQR